MKTVENNKAPLVSQYLCYNVGRIDEEPGFSGLAHFVEHMMFKGNGFSEIIDSLGGSDNAFTTNDMTCYHQNVASKHLETVMKMEAKRVRGIKFNQKDFDDEKKVIIEERLQRTDGNPSGIFNENLDKIFWEDSSYSIPTIGFMNEIKNLPLTKLKQFYDAWYHPNNAVLVISGDVKMDNVLNLAKKYYEKIPSKKLPQRLSVKKDFQNKNYSSEYILKHENNNQDMFVISYHVPSYFEEEDKNKIYRLETFSEIVGNDTIGRLYQKLVLEKKILLSVSTSYRSYSRLGGEFLISGIPYPNITKDQVVKEITDILKQDATDKELLRIKSRIKIDMIYMAEQPLMGASLIAPIIVNGVKLDDVENYVEKIQKVDLAELNKFKNEVLKNPFVGWLVKYEKD